MNYNRQYRVKLVFNMLGTYSKSYVIQKRVLIWFWITISEATEDRETAIKDCEEAQELHDKYNY